MKRELPSEHPLRQYFADILHRSLVLQAGLRDADVEAYLCTLLVDFVHQDSIYSIRDSSGRRVEAVVDLVAEGDVGLNADSFAREREVHKHIGDYLLLLSGVFPEFLKNLMSPNSKDALIDPVQQGRMSYYVASTFDYGDFASEAPIFRHLSSEFEAYIYGLSLVRASFTGFGHG